MFGFFVPDMFMYISTDVNCTQIHLQVNRGLCSKVDQISGEPTANCLSKISASRYQTCKCDTNGPKVWRKDSFTCDDQVCCSRNCVDLGLHHAHVLPGMLQLDVPHHQVACKPLKATKTTCFKGLFSASKSMITATLLDML